MQSESNQKVSLSEGHELSGGKSSKDNHGHDFKVEDAASDETRDPDWAGKEAILVRKLDMTLLPMVWVLYMFNYLDRNNIA